MNAVETAEMRIHAVLQGVKDAGVMVKNESEISAYLSKHGQILEIAEPLAEALSKVFPEDQIIFRYWWSREDANDHFPEFVIRSKQVANLMNRIWKFCEDNEHLLSFTEGWISVLTDYHPPE